MSERTDGRRANELRTIRIQPGFVNQPEGSVLIECGATRVICTASIEEKVPPFLRGAGSGWITSEYGMLPGSTSSRTIREVSRGRPSGRTQEIQRLIGRALRAVVDLQALGERTVWVDCDVIQADGGTRTASITGGFVALVLAIHSLYGSGRLGRPVVREYLAGVSVGIVGGRPLLDLSYHEDVSAEVDMNIVMTGKGCFVELQGTAEREPFGGDQLTELLSLGRQGIGRLIEFQKEALSSELGRGLEDVFESDSVPAGDKE